MSKSVVAVAHRIHTMMAPNVAEWGFGALYPGVRADVAIALGIAPNDPVFHAAWNIVIDGGLYYVPGGSGAKLGSINDSFQCGAQ